MLLIQSLRNSLFNICISRISFLLPATDDLADDFDRLNNIVKRLPRMAELTIQSKIQFNSSEMITEFLLMLSGNHQNIQVKSCQNVLSYY